MLNRILNINFLHCVRPENLIYLICAGQPVLSKYFTCMEVCDDYT